MRRFSIFVLSLLGALLISHELSLSLPVLGGGPDVLILVVVAFSTGERPAACASYGFGAGFVRDLQLESPAGISAFAYALTAYAVGLVGEVRGVWVLIGLVAGSTFVSQVLYGFGTLLLSESAAMSSLPRVALVTTAYNTLLAPLVVPILRRLAAPAGQEKTA